LSGFSGSGVKYRPLSAALFRGGVPNAPDRLRHVCVRGRVQRPSLGAGEATHLDHFTARSVGPVDSLRPLERLRYVLSGRLISRRVRRLNPDRSTDTST
jgi:hypothetical protein